MEPTTAMFRTVTAEPEGLTVYPLFGQRALHPPLARSRSMVLEEERRLRARDAACRALNVLVAAVLLVLAFPLMLVIALAVRLSSPGPVIYVQDRVGLDRRRRRAGQIGEERRRANRGGRIFRIYKFRTMTASAIPGPQVWATPDDPRVTRLGALLRAYRLDELPQLVNVLRGDMNLVGPRPEQPEIFESLSRAVPSYCRRQTVLPGITGWAQINQGYDQTVDDVRRKLGYDLDYVQRRGVVQDLAIMARTAPVMVMRQGSQ